MVLSVRVIVQMHTTHTIHLNNGKKLVAPICHKIQIAQQDNFFMIFTISKLKNLILIFCFGCCCSPSSFFLSSFSIACMLVCARLDSNALVDTLCCSIAPCGSPCILERYVHGVAVCCTTNKKRGEEGQMLLWVQLFLIYLLLHPVFAFPRLKPW